MTSVALRNFESADDAQVARQQDAAPTYLRGASFPIGGRAFTTARRLNAYYYAYVPDYVSTPTIDLLWYITGAQSTGSVSWVSRIAAISPGDAVRLSDKAYATGNFTATSVLDEQILTKTTITVTNTDSLAAGDLVVVNIYREPGNVTCGGTAVLIACSFNYTGS